LTEDNLHSPFLIVIWDHEVGGLRRGIVESLDEKLKLQLIEEIEPAEFFSFSGVEVKGNVIQFPMSKFYSCPNPNIFVLVSHAPSRAPYEFLTRILDFAIDQCGVKELYIAGGVVTSIAHSSPRRVFGIVNRPELKKVLEQCDVHTGMDYQTPPGGGTSLSNFLLWVAMTRKLAGCTLWVEVPFYLANHHDPLAAAQMLRVLDTRFNLGLELHQIEHETQKLSANFQELGNQNVEISRYLELLERGIMLSEGEVETLTKEVSHFLYTKE
jgi:proteasome assembly chaperone (PAC2) family protein